MYLLPDMINFNAIMQMSIKERYLHWSHQRSCCCETQSTNTTLHHNHVVTHRTYIQSWIIIILIICPLMIICKRRRYITHFLQDFQWKFLSNNPITYFILLDLHLSFTTCLWIGGAEWRHAELRVWSSRRKLSYSGIWKPLLFRKRKLTRKSLMMKCWASQIWREFAFGCGLWALRPRDYTKQSTVRCTLMTERKSNDICH